MLVAIATFGAEVSPRFCFAREVLVADLDADGDGGAPVPLGPPGYPGRLRILADRGVGLLICGGFQRSFLPVAEGAGIHVVWGIAGPVAAALADARAGRLAPPVTGGGCRCRRPTCPRFPRRHSGGETSKEETTHVRKQDRRRGL